MQTYIDMCSLFQSGAFTVLCKFSWYAKLFVSRFWPLYTFQ